MIYLDSCVLIYAHEHGGEPGQRVRDALERNRSTRFAISPLVMHEVLVMPLRRRATALLDSYVRAFDEYEVLEIRTEDYLDAARLRAAHKGLRTPDALHIAAARRNGCTALWTNDKRLATASEGLAVDVIG